MSICSARGPGSSMPSCATSWGSVARRSTYSRWPGSCWSPSSHTFPFVYPAGRERACNRSMRPTRKPRRSSAPASSRTALTVTAPLVAPAILSGSAARLRQRHRLVRLAGHHRAAGPDRDAADADLRAVRLSAAIWPRLGAVAGVRRDHRGGALFAQRRFLARRSYVTLAGKGSPRQLLRSRPARWLLLGILRRSCSWSRSSLPYAALIAVSFSKSWGLAFWKQPDVRQLSFHAVRIRRHAARDPQQPHTWRPRRPAWSSCCWAP